MKKSIKVFVLILLIINIADPIFSSVYKSPKKLSVITTKYFDIIFSQESEFSANLLAQKADDVYIEICEKIDSTPYFRLPVVITQDTDILNAYYTCYPYNRIVLYDTLPHSNSMAVFSESLINVFYHELTHAVSLQKKSDTFKFLSKIFGDVVTPSQFVNLPLSFIEGVTVSFESMNGEGRLNDSFATHILKQAKLEGKFPSWKEASYTRDIYPIGTIPYIFGGSFNAYIQNRFGLAKYAEFWTLCGSTFSFEQTIFKKVYGISLDKAWSDFENSIPVPIESNTVFLSSDEQGIHTKKVLNYNSERLIDISNYPDRLILKNKNKQKYYSLCASDSNLYWIDSSSKGVFSLAIEKAISDNQGKAKKLFSVDSNANGLSISKDNKFLVLSTIEPNTEKNICKVYDLSTKKKISEFKNYTEGSIVTLQDKKEYFVGVKITGQTSKIEFIDLQTKNVSFTKENPLYTISFLPKDDGNGNIVYIKKEKQNWYISFYNPISKQEKNLYLENSPVIHSITPVYKENSVELYCSYASSFVDDTLPRFAIISYEKNQNEQTISYDVQMQQIDISGGVYNPVGLKDDLFYISCFFDHDEILKLPKSVFKLEKKESKLINQTEIVTTENNIDIEKSQHEQNINFSKKPYYSIKYLTKGVLFPVSLLQLSADTEDTLPINLGLTYITSDPSESWNYSLTGVYEVLSSKSAAQFILDNTSTPVDFCFDTTFYGSTNDRWATYSTLNMSYDLFLDLSYKYFTFSNTSYFVGQNGFENTLLRLVNDDGYLLANNFQVVYSNLHTSALNYYEQKGFQTGLGCTFASSHTQSFVQTQTDLFLTMILNLYTPLFENNENTRLTTNFPTQIKCVLFPNIYELFTVNAETVLFSIEVQKGIAYLPLYLNRFAVKLGYSGTTIYPENYELKYDTLINQLSNYNQMKYNQEVICKFKCIFVPVAGNLTNLKLNLGLDIHYDIQENNFSFALGGILDL